MLLAMYFYPALPGLLFYYQDWGFLWMAGKTFLLWTLAVPGAVSAIFACQLYFYLREQRQRKKGDE